MDKRSYAMNWGRFLSLVVLSIVLPSASWGQSSPTALDLFNRFRAGDKGALAALRSAAESGKAESQFHLGRAYSFGSSILPRDNAAAAQWVEKAAQQGHAEAQANLGYLYSAGLGVPKDAEKAIFWWRRAAEAGFAPAQFNLGLAFEEGNLVPKDEAQAFVWMKRAAAQGVANAQLKVGLMYGRGIGTKRDDREAANWFRKAADQGHEIAMANLGSMYANGEGVTKNAAEALRWLRKPVANGNAGAIAIYNGVCRENAALCDRERPPAHFVFEMSDRKLRITIPDAPQMRMNTHPAAGVNPHARFMGAGPNGYTISVLLPTADSGMRPMDCARSMVTSISRRYGLKRDDIVTRQTNETTVVMLFPVKVESLMQMKAYLLSGDGGTHCVEVHLSKITTSENELSSWLKGFAAAKIEKY